jgi:hypothetical protein
LSQYRKIHHIGGINGNYTALMRYFKCGLEDSDLYIFTGDYTCITGDYFGTIGGYSTGEVENAEVKNF